MTVVYNRDGKCLLRGTKWVFKVKTVYVSSLEGLKDCKCQGFHFVAVHALSAYLKKKYSEEYMVLNMKMGNGKVGRIEN